MTRSTDIKSINCTSCGAGLDVLGGGRVKVMVCGYCGSELDAQDNFAVLRKFADLKRPNSLFSIGMSGVIDGVSFTVIGTLGMTERWQRRIWTWVEHQVFSPTHGYAYLTVEDGKLSFTRRYRGMTRPAWISPTTVEMSESRPRMGTPEGTYSYFETSTAEISFVEGEFNWRPEIGARTTSVSMLGSNAMLHFSRSAAEEEVLRTQYLPAAEVYASFGVVDPPRPTGFNILKPFSPGRHQRFFAVSSIAFAVVALVMSFAVTGSPDRESDQNLTFNIKDLPQEIPFEITEKDRLAVIQVGADVDNSWAYVGVYVADPEDVPVFEVGRTVERYSGRDKDGAWSEGRSTSVLRFIPRQTGTYQVEVNLEEAETWEREGDPLGNVTLRLQQDVPNGRWLLGVGLVFALFGSYHHLRPMFHQSRRMRQSDWSDD
ncbi:DUF4178 domain-containing protein [Tateyamaria sp.]|uniref:DUF4178 domain-containing protein n=1 Tax=Tateyamaria sp. TaxID=1929288 RepID=UPI00329F8C2C